MTNSHQLSRRDFLAGASTLAGAMAVPSLLWAKSPNEKLNLAFIGVGGRGGANLNTITQAGNDNVVAICDVNESSLGRAAKRFPQARIYQRLPQTLRRSQRH